MPKVTQLEAAKLGSHSLYCKGPRVAMDRKRVIRGERESQS